MLWIHDKLNLAIRSLYYYFFPPILTYNENTNFINKEWYVMTQQDTNGNSIDWSEVTKDQHYISDTTQDGRGTNSTMWKGIGKWGDHIWAIPDHICRWPHHACYICKFGDLILVATCLNDLGFFPSTTDEPEIFMTKKDNIYDTRRCCHHCSHLACDIAAGGSIAIWLSKNGIQLLAARHTSMQMLWYYNSYKIIY